MKSEKMLVALGMTGLCLFLTPLFSGTWASHLRAGETNSEENLRRYLKPTLMGPEVSVAPPAGDRGQSVPPNFAGRGREEVLWEAPVAPEPMWKSLERLSPKERANAQIELGLPRDASQAALARARKVEEVWNGGCYEEALELFRTLGALVDLMEVAVGISWREPVRSSGADWGGDVQVSAEDAVYDVALDFHAATGHLFAALLYFDGAGWRWSVNFSSDGGQTWSETYFWGAPYHQRDMDGKVLEDHFYVGFTGQSDQSEAHMMRFSAADGLRDVGYGIQTAFDASPNSIVEVALATQADFDRTRSYYFGIISNGELWCYWSPSGGTSWSATASYVSNADRGLDACYSGPPFSFHEVWACYIGTTDSVYVGDMGASLDWDFDNLDLAGSGTFFSSVSAYDDTVIVVFEHLGETYWIKYQISYNDGGSWAWWYVGDTTATSYCPDVTSRKGDGMGVTFASMPGRQGMYTWRDYPLGVWSPPVQYNDYALDFSYQPAIEWVASGVYGIVYVTYPDRYAYFDRSDRVGVEEQESGIRHQASGIRLLQNWPNPFGAGGTTVSFNVKRSTLNVSLRVYDLSGRLVTTLVDGDNGPGYHTVSWDGRDETGEDVAGGVYFFTLSAGDFKNTRKGVVIR